MADLGIFIDESGDVGSNSDFYIVTLILHDQSTPIGPQVERLEAELAYLGVLPRSIVHAGPLVRREEGYRNVSLEFRRRVFSKMFSFVRLCGVKHKSFCVCKREHGGQLAIKGRLAGELGAFLRDNLGYFQSFDKVIVYYDNGQALVTDLINTVFSAFLSRGDVRKISHADYRLCQAADLVCTLELLRVKGERGVPMSRSEEIFFESGRRLSKVYLKALEKLSFG